MTSRRSFLTLIGAGAAGAAAGKDKFTGPLGLEIYSLGRELSKDVPGTLSQVRRFGFDEVEVPNLYGLTAGEFRAELDQAGLRSTAMVAQDEQLRRNFDATVKDATTLGARHVILPWIPHPGNDFTAETCLRAADQMNRWGTDLRKAGLTLCYHPHGFEFRPGPEGTLFDLLVEKTDPTAVNFQADVFWMAWPARIPQGCCAAIRSGIFSPISKTCAKGLKQGI